ncbi:sigma-70 family RNA polymerase sigma factor [Streptomyces galbus]|uniref:Sigma-70 family RNA polymerase sigma factor n=2 Tax=Streptomyces galbus TaxID=33898 RepID=A0A4U5WU33_STRGB|nr:sigma-70 family RNA polymerase sigma factor [Streptomyces galbus]TKT05968.1 sigma-70 family RNA polymerase sigma factor [Streptomyces galbus]GHD37991.1 hypothetical protein GCM10010335_35970 [Streptomyces galbus]
MSGDGRDESLGDGDADTGHRPPQVPGRGGRPTASHEGVPAQGGTPVAGAPDHSVPAQREWRGRHGDDVPPSPYGGPQHEGPQHDGPRHGGPPHDAPPSDAELIDRMRSGDDTAYEELYRRHAHAVRRYARTCCRDGHTADDLTAEVFARMLQAVRGGSGPEHAVRAYLLTSVRRVAAHWTRTAKREHLVDDFAVFAAQASCSSEVADDDTLELGADVRAMHEAEQSMAMRAFRSLPERWQAVLWHTEVEDESPSEVAVLFGLDANGTRVLASRAREGLKQAYLQAHVSTTLTSDEECARYADQLGTYARRRLRVRAERGLRKHLEECARCRLAAAQIEEVAGSIPAVVPVAVIGWFGAAGYAKALGLVAGGAGAGAAGAAGAAAAGGGSSGGGAGGAASEGLGAPVKAGIAAGVVAVAAAVVALALVGHDTSPPQRPEAEPRASAPAVAPAPTAPAPTPPGEQTGPVTAPTPGRTPTPAPAVTPDGRTSPRPAPPPARTPGSTPTPTPTPSPTATPTPTPTPPPPPPPVPARYRLDELAFDVVGDGTGPEIRLAGSSWVWQRSGLSIAERHYARGATVHGDSSVTVDLNRSCSSYDAMVGVDDLTLKLGHVYFSVYADGVRLWRSGRIKGGDPAVPVHVDLTGRRTVRLVVEPHTPFDTVALADWADSAFSCS